MLYDPVCVGSSAVLVRWRRGGGGGGCCCC